jgi:iron complex outermembrane receptor protein
MTKKTWWLDLESSLDADWPPQQPITIADLVTEARAVDWDFSTYMENANLLTAPGYALVNVNLHYDTEIDHSYLKGAVYFFEVKNVLDKTYIASANNITNSINAVTGVQNPGSVLASTGTGSIYAGAPRTYVAGMRLAFR